MKAGHILKTKQGKQTAQRKSASVIAPGGGSLKKWISYVRMFKRKHFSNRKASPIGKGARGRRF